MGERTVWRDPHAIGLRFKMVAAEGHVRVPEGVGGYIAVVRGLQNCCAPYGFGATLECSEEGQIWIAMRP